MPNSALFHDFLVPVDLYRVVENPPSPASIPHSLRFQAHQQILIPQAVVRPNSIVPAAINNAFGSGAPAVDAISIHLRVNTDVGMLYYSERVFDKIDPPKKGPLHAEAHAVALNDGSKPAEGFLRYFKGDPLWILKEPVEGCRRTKRSRLTLSPFAVKMANLRTGEMGYVMTNDVKLYPHRKMDARGSEILMSSIGYIPLPSVCDDDTSQNNVEPDDTFTTPLPPMRHWIPQCREEIIFVINHRTGRYGYLPLRCLRALEPPELNEWGYLNNEPIDTTSAQDKVRYPSVSSYGSSPARSDCLEDRGLHDFGPIDDRRDLNLPEPESLAHQYREDEGGFGWREDDWAAVNAMRSSGKRRVVRNRWACD